MAKPVILGVEGYALRFLEKSEAGIGMTPEDPDDLNRVLEELAADPELCYRMGESGRQFVMTHYNRDDLASQYMDVIDTILRGSRDSNFPPSSRPE